MSDTEQIKAHRIVRADEVGIKGTVLEQVIRDGKCIICGDLADREIWIYERNGQESTNKVEKTNYACSPECGEMIVWRG